MSRNFKPLETVAKLENLTQKKKQIVFLSPNSDWISLIFYGKLQGIDNDFWIPNYPGKTALEGAEDAEIFYLTVRNEADLEIIKNKFNLKNAKPIDTDGLDKIYEVEK